MPAVVCFLLVCQNPAMTCLLAAALILQGSTSISGHTREVSCIATSPKSAIAASGSVDLTIRLWDTDTKKSIGVLEGHGGEVHTVAFSPDGKLLASGERYNKVKVWDVASQKEVQTWADSESSVLGVVFSTDGKQLFGACKDGNVRVWTLGSPAEGKKLRHSYMVNAITVTPDGKSIVSADDGGTISFWDTKTLKQTRTLTQGAAVRCLAISANGKWLTTGSLESVKLWDVATGAEKASAKGEANSLCFTPDGSRIFVGTQDNLVLCLNAADLSQVWKQEKHERPVTGVAITSDGKSMISSSMDYMLRVWPLK